MNTHLGHFNFAISLKEKIANGHADEVRPQPRPRLVVDLVEESERIVRVGHVVVDEGDVSRRYPRADHQRDERERRDLKVIRSDDQDHRADDVELRVVGHVPTPQHAL